MKFYAEVTVTSNRDGSITLWFENGAGAHTKRAVAGAVVTDPKDAERIKTAARNYMEDAKPAQTVRAR